MSNTLATLVRVCDEETHTQLCIRSGPGINLGRINAFRMERASISLGSGPGHCCLIVTSNASRQ